MNRSGKNDNQHSDRFYFTSGYFHICGNTGPNFAQINHGWSSVHDGLSNVANQSNVV